MKFTGDIDIDFSNRDNLLSLIPHIPASRIEQGELKRHNTGVYLHKIPLNPIINASNIDFESAEKRGYFKIDFLNVSLYNEIKNEEHLIKLMNQEPLWDLLQQEEFVDLLFHLRGHGAILKKSCPNSMEQLAAVLAMIRPAKRYLIGKDWDTIMKEIWIKPNNGEYYFKRSHGIAYAHVITVHMNLLCEKIENGELILN